MITLLGYMGAGALALAPFIISSWQGQLLAMTGLAMLIPQALKLRAFNLVSLNSIGIIGYFFSLITG